MMFPKLFKKPRHSEQSSGCGVTDRLADASPSELSSGCKATDRLVDITADALLSLSDDVRVYSPCAVIHNKIKVTSTRLDVDTCTTVELSVFLPDRRNQPATWTTLYTSPHQNEILARGLQVAFAAVKGREKAAKRARVEKLLAELEK